MFPNNPLGREIIKKPVGKKMKVCSACSEVHAVVVPSPTEPPPCDDHDHDTTPLQCQSYGVSQNLRDEALNFPWIGRDE